MENINYINEFNREYKKYKGLNNGINSIDKLITDGDILNNVYMRIKKCIKIFENKINNLRNIIEVIKYIENIDLSVEEKFIFLINSISFIDNPSLHNTYLPYVICTYMEQHADEIINILSSNSDVLQDFITCYKSVGLELSTGLSFENMHMKKRIFNIEEFKNGYLKSDDFNPEAVSLGFYEILPQDCAYLIGYVNATNMDDPGYLFRLYLQYFNGILSNEEIYAFSLYHFDLDRNNNLFQLPIKEKNYSLVLCLQRFLEDKKSVLKFRILRDKYGLDYKTLINFIAKYGKTKIYDSLFNSNLADYEELINLIAKYDRTNIDFSKLSDSNDFDSEIADKIKYLAQENVIENIDSISDLSMVTISELSTMPRISKKVLGNLLGGPNAKTDAYAFYDGFQREIRRIDTDGAYSVEPIIDWRGGHDYATRKIYQDTTDVYENESLMATERALLAVEKISSVTFIIEGEVCCIIMPSNLTIEQLVMLKHIFADLTDVCEVAIMRYDSDKGITIYENDGDTMNKSEVLRFIKNYEENIFSKLDKSVNR